MMQQDLQEQGHDQDRLRAGLLLSGPWTGCAEGLLDGLMRDFIAQRRVNEDGPH
jgi:hypothetical protein